MRRTLTCATGALTLALAVPVAAQDFKVHVDLFGQKKPASPKAPAIDWSKAPPADSNAPEMPRIVCGMTVVPADPKVDPKMRVAPPDDGVRYAMKVVVPTVCKP